VFRVTDLSVSEHTSSILYVTVLNRVGWSDHVLVRLMCVCVRERERERGNVILSQVHVCDAVLSVCAYVGVGVVVTASS